MLRLLSFLTVLYLIFLGASAQAAVWANNPNRGWLTQVPENDRPGSDIAPNGVTDNYTYEDYYSDWVEHKVDIDSLATKHLKPTDCKQAVYLIRLYFAAIHRLPFVISVPSGKGYVTLSNDTTLFDNVSDFVSRVYAFMDYVQSKVTIQSLSRDTYPVHIDKMNLRPGAILIIMPGPGQNHSLTIWHVDQALGNITFINGTDEPTSISQDTAKFLEVSELEHSTHPYKNGEDGFRMWRHREIPLSAERGYDPVDQYSTAFRTFTDTRENSPSFHKWAAAVQYRFNPNLDPWDELQADLKDIKTLADNRAFVVRNFEIYKREKLGGGCLTGAQYDSAETRTRDANIKEALKAIDDFLAREASDEDIGKYQASVNQFLNIDNTVSYGLDPNDENRSLTLEEFREHMLSGLASMNPNDSIDRKWGFIYPNDPASTCPRH